MSTAENSQAVKKKTKEEEFEEEIGRLARSFGDPGYTQDIKRVAERFGREQRDVIKLVLARRKDQSGS